MKFIALKIIRFYQAFTRSGVATPFFFGSFSGCRSWPTCSEFAHEAIVRHGVVVGSTQALQRVLHCHSMRSSSPIHQ